MMITPSSRSLMKMLSAIAEGRFQLTIAQSGLNVCVKGYQGKSVIFSAVNMEIEPGVLIIMQRCLDILAAQVDQNLEDVDVERA